MSHYILVQYNGVAIIVKASTVIDALKQCAQHPDYVSTAFVSITKLFHP